MDPRIKELAKVLVRYSLKVQEGENVLIEISGDESRELARELVKEVYASGGCPYVELRDERISRELVLGGNPEVFRRSAEYELDQMKRMDCFIGIRGASNVNEMADIPGDTMQDYMSLHRMPVTNRRVDHTRWVVLRYPNASMAQLASTSLESFENFYFDVCTMDYSKMGAAMEPLKALMEKTDKVRIVGEGTDLTFSIKGIPAVICAGELNIPDGEIYTAPVRDSIQGTIRYNTPAVYQGFTYEDVELTFKDGKIVDATANDTERINQIFNTDEGARYVGEFAIGVNPFILNPMKDTLFDEKIMGSFHFTPGEAYENADNGNRSSVHWDLVVIQTEEYGGGEIYFDDVLIRKDGRFVLPELDCLNPENLR